MPPDINEIIEELPLTFVNMILEETDLEKLHYYNRRFHCYNRRAVIQFRIDFLKEVE